MRMGDPPLGIGKLVDLAEGEISGGSEQHKRECEPEEGCSL